jgi:cyclopropane fatty-acyl-phospholipid synthase-like methyltransferase
MTEPESFRFPAVTDETIERYKQNYRIPHSTTITKDMVQHHIDVEFGLTQKLLNSKREERAGVWESSYNELYRQLPWLTDSASIYEEDQSLEYQHILKLIPPGSAVIEIGSGKGLLANYLTQNNRQCVATEIASERGIRDDGPVSWHETDGIHLDKFEPDKNYDTIISMQVIEHFHPDDVREHFTGAFKLLQPGGQYVFTTPHVFFGPADFSTVLLLDRSYFMHLKEYTHRELGEIASEVGFRDIAAVYVPPTRFRRMFPFVLRSRMLYRYLCVLERLLDGARVPRILLRALLFHRDVFLVVTK